MIELIECYIMGRLGRVLRNHAVSHWPAIARQDQLPPLHVAGQQLQLLPATMTHPSSCRPRTERAPSEGVWESTLSPEPRADRVAKGLLSSVGIPTSTLYPGPRADRSRRGWESTLYPGPRAERSSWGFGLWESLAKRSLNKSYSGKAPAAFPM